MAAGNYPIIAEQGAKFARSILYENPDGTLVNLTGYSARMQVRQRPSSPAPILTLTSELGGGITLGGAAGTITISIPATTMATAPEINGFYDLELIPPTGEADVIRLIEGSFTIKREITRV